MSEIKVVRRHAAEREERAVTTGTKAWELFADQPDVTAARVGEVLKDLSYELADGDEVELHHLPESVRGAIPHAPPGSYRAACERASDAAGRDYLLQLLRRTSGNVTHAAAEAGVERESMHRLLKRHGIDPSRFRTA